MKKKKKVFNKTNNSPEVEAPQSVGDEIENLGLDDASRPEHEEMLKVVDVVDLPGVENPEQEQGNQIELFHLEKKAGKLQKQFTKWTERRKKLEKKLKKAGKKKAKVLEKRLKKAKKKRKELKRAVEETKAVIGSLGG
jgi:seryl-tRNA synthetase